METEIFEGWENNYEGYIEYQTRKSLKTKKQTSRYMKERFPRILNAMKEAEIKGESILCVGARDKREIDFFLENGYKEALGIDLFDDEKIMKCDMSKIHEHPVLKTKKFDVVFSHESIEHCLDLEGFVKGLNLICKKYFVCKCPNVKRINKWDAARHPFMLHAGKLAKPGTQLRAMQEEEIKEKIVECFPGFRLEFLQMWKGLFFVLNRTC